MDHVVVYVARCIQNGLESLGLKALEDFDVELEAAPIAEFHRSVRVLSTTLYRKSLLSIDSVVFFRVASAFVSLLG
jgi:hypothetical protein